MHVVETSHILDPSTTLGVT